MEGMMNDLISRQAAIEYLMTNMNWYDEDGYESDDDYKRKCITDLINGVPSAQPERKTGRWIHDGSKWANRWICDRCKYKLFGVKTKFCPDCGAKMEVEHGE